jgi:hypothetical protein
MSIKTRVESKSWQKCLNGSKLNHIFLTGSQQVTKVGFSNTTLKPKGRVRNGKRHILQGRRKLTRANQKSRLFFSDSRGVVHKEFVPPGVTVNQKYYLEVLDRLKNRVMQVRLKTADDWILRALSQRARTHSIVNS